MSGRHWIASLIFGWVGFCLCLAGCQGMVATWPNGNPMFVPSSGTTVRATSRQVNYPPGNTQTAYQGYSSGVIPTGYQGQSSMSAGMPVSPGMPVGPISSSGSCELIATCSMRSISRLKAALCVSMPDFRNDRPSRCSF